MRLDAVVWIALLLTLGGLGATPTARAQAGAAIEWLTIPGGSFRMGSTSLLDGKPEHLVTVPTFQMARSEVTKTQYKACVEAGACTAPACNWPAWPGEELTPVSCVTWEQAVAFSSWVGGRLPSEAEWEYAARSGGHDWRYPWGNDDATCEKAVVWGCGKGPAPVCSRPAGRSSQGLCDLVGNVWEWTADWYHESYEGAPTDGSAWVDPPGEQRVFRGGCWARYVWYAWTAYRSFHTYHRLDHLGLRPARSVDRRGPGAPR